MDNYFDWLFNKLVVVIRNIEVVTSKLPLTALIKCDHL